MSVSPDSVTSTTESPGEIPRSGHRLASGNVIGKAAGNAGVALGNETEPIDAKHRCAGLTAPSDGGETAAYASAESPAFRRGEDVNQRGERKVPRSGEACVGSVDEDGDV